MFPGGTNILRNTNANALLSSGNWGTGSWIKSSSYDIISVPITDAPNPDIVYGIKVNDTSSTSTCPFWQPNIPLVLDTEYTISCYARRLSGSGDVYLQYGATGGFKRKNFSDITSSWTRLQFTFIPTVVGATTFGSVEAATGEVEFCGMKLELGNKATDWSMSPWDIENPNSEWKKLDLTSDFMAYNGLDTNIPRYKKVGGSIHVKGVLAPASNDNNLGSATITAIAPALPTGYRPTDLGVNLICQGSGIGSWLLQCSTGGVLYASRYRSNGAYVTPTTSYWLPFYLVFAP